MRSPILKDGIEEAEVLRSKIQHLLILPEL
jgi:hypothetical protein